jgi:hypothetical protein
MMRSSVFWCGDSRKPSSLARVRDEGEPATVEGEANGGRMKIKRTVATPVLVALIGVVSGGFLLQQGVDPRRNVYFQARLLEEVVRHISTRFVDETNPDRLYRMAIDGMLLELGDPHSTFMTPDD